jgi:hypothetical protein
MFLVKIGISTTLVCFCGIDDFDVDGRRNVVYNDERFVSLSAVGILKICERFGVVCTVICCC